jgi:hypothetical protein
MPIPEDDRPVIDVTTRQLAGLAHIPANCDDLVGGDSTLDDVQAEQPEPDLQPGGIAGCVYRKDLVTREGACSSNPECLPTRIANIANHGECDQEHPDSRRNHCDSVEKIPDGEPKENHDDGRTDHRCDPLGACPRHQQLGGGTHVHNQDIGLSVACPRDVLSVTGGRRSAGLSPERCRITPIRHARNDVRPSPPIC